MRHALVLLAILLSLLGPLSLSEAVAVDGPAAASDRDTGHGHAVAPVPGRVLRPFSPPPTRFAAGHRGVDLAAHAGEPVGAAMGGTVTFAGRVARVGWVTVNHGGGVDTTYGPLAPQTVSAGEVVAAGGLIGFVAQGATHLDWGARVAGEYVDPLSLLGRWEAYLTSEAGDGHPPLGGAGAVVGSPAGGPSRFVWPTSGGVTSGFGTRVHPVTGRRRTHAGIDIGAAHGTPVRAAAAGTVTFAGSLSGYGTTVVVDHGHGLSTLYAHLAGAGARTGQAIPLGGVLGRVGATGLATGPHLHFEVRRAGVPQPPLSWLSRRNPTG